MSSSKRSRTARELEINMNDDPVHQIQDSSEVELYF